MKTQLWDTFKMWITFNFQKSARQAKRISFSVWRFAFRQAFIFDISIKIENDFFQVGKSFLPCLAAWRAFIKKGPSRWLKITTTYNIISKN